MSDDFYEFDEAECEWCGSPALGVTERNDGYWADSCGAPNCSHGGPYRGAR